MSIKEYEYTTVWLKKFRTAFIKNWTPKVELMSKRDFSEENFKQA